MSTTTPRATESIGSEVTEGGRVASEQALVSDTAPVGQSPSGFDPSRWLPIADAPRDGTTILCWWNDLPFPVRWSRGPDRMNLYGWRIATWEKFDFLFFTDPEWWMPVMDGPRDSDASSSEEPKGLSGEAVAARPEGIAK